MGLRGAIRSWWEGEYLDALLAKIVKELVGDKLIDEDSPAHGIARKVVFEGYDALSPAQQHISRKKVLPLIQDAEPGFDLSDCE